MDEFRISRIYKQFSLTAAFTLIAATGLTFAVSPAVQAQSEPANERVQLRAENRPLPSLAQAAAEASMRPVQPGPPSVVPNFVGKGQPAIHDGIGDLISALQTTTGTGSASLVSDASTSGFPGASNYGDNGPVNGYLVAPPDTDGQIGGATGQYFVQMINSLTTIFDRTGTRLVDSFASNAFWAGIGGNCEPNNQGDPIVLYDEVNNRWLVSQFAFPDSFNSFSQCVAISQTDDPAGGYNRYEFSFDNIGFPDYPKHGIVSDSITLMANIFKPRGPFFNYAGTFLGVMDKQAMYAGDPATLIGFNIGTSEFGFVAGDLDGPGSAPALFATAMSNANSFDIWQIDVDWNTQNASVGQVAAIPISPYDGTLCGASRGACVPQPDGGPALESLSDRLMHRLQIRDFGDHRTMVASHTVDAGGNDGPAGIRWYEFRESGGSWSLHQEGTYAPDDGVYRFMPSIAMNELGDIGLGYLMANTLTYLSIGVTGQSATEGANASGLFDAEELICAPGSGVQLDVARAGDYSSTSVDPSDGTTFWHTNEYVTVTDEFSWDTFVCPFTIGDGSGGGGNGAPSAVITSATCTDLNCDFDGSGSSDPDGDTLTYAWDFGDGNSGTGVTTSHNYASGGSYTVTLTVSDGSLSDSASTTVNPDDGVNSPPTVNITTAACSDLNCSFEASGSDSDGTIAGYAWNFGDGSTGSGASTSHTYAAAGDYLVEVTVTDNEGATGSDSTTVTATEPSTPTTMSVASIAVGTVNIARGNKAGQATVTILDDQGSAVSGATVAGTFSGDYSESTSAVTGSDGVATLQTTSTARGAISFTFCVDNVTDASLSYDDTANAQTCASF